MSKQVHTHERMLHRLHCYRRLPVCGRMQEEKRKRERRGGIRRLAAAAWVSTSKSKPTICQTFAWRLCLIGYEGVKSLYHQRLSACDTLCQSVSALTCALLLTESVHQQQRHSLVSGGRRTRTPTRLRQQLHLRFSREDRVHTCYLEVPCVVVHKFALLSPTQRCLS